MMKRKKLANLISVVLTALVILFAGCVEEETSPEVEDLNVAPESVEDSSESIAETESELEFELYQNDEFGYSISYPGDWIIITSAEGDMERPDFEGDMERPDTEGDMEIPDMEGDMGSPVFGGNMEGGVLFEGPESGIMLMVNVVSEYDIDELEASGAEEVVINGMEAYEITIQSMPKITMKLVIFPADDRYYVVSGNSPTELFDQYADVFDTSINSFVIET